MPVDTDVPPVPLQSLTGTDGLVPLRRLGRVALDGIGRLDVWWVGVYGGGARRRSGHATSRDFYLMSGGRYAWTTPSPAVGAENAYSSRRSPDLPIRGSPAENRGRLGAMLAPRSAQLTY